MKVINASLVLQHAALAQGVFLAHLVSMDTSSKMVYVPRIALFLIMPTQLQGYASLQGVAVLTMEKTQHIHANQVAQLVLLQTLPYIDVMLVLQHVSHVLL